MSLFAQTTTGDIDFGPSGRGFSLITGQEEARARLQTVLQLVAGEVKRDSRIGLDFGFIFDPLVTGSQISNHVAAVMLSSPGIVDAEVNSTLRAQIGRLEIDATVIYDADDQNERRPIRERFSIDLGQDIGGILSG